MKLWSTFVDLTSRREPATALACFRIAVGLCVVVTLGSVVAADLVEVIWVDRSHGGYRDLTGNWLVRLLGGPTPAVMWRLTIGGIAAGLLTTVGLGGRLLPLITLQLFMATTDTNGQAGGSYDNLIQNALWLLVLAPSTATLSVDCRATTGSWHSDAPVPAWTRYLAIYQLFLMYWTTGLQKVSAYWVPGGDFSALYYILQQPTWRRVDLSFLAWLFPLTQVATAVTWLWEWGAPVLLLAYFYRYTADRPGRLRAAFNRVDVRLWYAGLGVLFHVLVTIPMNIGPFSLISLSYYFCLFTPEELQRAAARLSPARSAR